MEMQRYARSLWSMLHPLVSNCVEICDTQCVFVSPDRFLGCGSGCRQLYVTPRNLSFFDSGGSLNVVGPGKEHVGTCFDDVRILLAPVRAWGLEFAARTTGLCSATGSPIHHRNGTRRHHHQNF
jgi:hypothetical protein